ncbi:MAG: hypothetical protein JNL10_05950 [Verrucomicrobiales bacterium]|nr:hypothetical protein [Verrucomicrobiales bacterium]
MTSPVQTPASPESVPPEGIQVTAGPWTALFHDGDLRYVRLGGREVLRRVYGAVRDRHWNTLPGTTTGLRVETSPNSFHIRYTRLHQVQEAQVVWRANITGDADGVVRFELDGEVLNPFLSNRIGLCVLHPLLECAGARCRTLHADGTSEERRFPEQLAPSQPVDGFTDLAGLSHEIEPGLWAELEFEGDRFETEDQRHWIDASLKTYSTPLRLPKPVAVPAGMRIRQRVTLRLRAEPGRKVGPTIRPPTEDPIHIHLAGAHTWRVPEMGLGMASHGQPLSPSEVQRLSRLGVSHLGVDLKLSDPRWPEHLRTAARDALELGAALELGIHLPVGNGGNLGDVALLLGRMKVDLVRALILRDGERSTPPADLEQARDALKHCGMALGVGTRGDLYDLVLQPPPGTGDFLGWSMNPQVHATDDLSLAETPEGAAHQAAALRRANPERALVVSPVTLKPRSSAVDPRQRLPLAAAWTLALFKALAEGGVDSVTFFETTGWQGVIETERGSPAPDLFPSQPGEVFPVYHVLADLGEFARGEVIPTRVDTPLSVVPLLIRLGNRHRLWIANPSATPRRISLSGSGHPKVLQWRCLDAQTLAEAGHSPDRFRSRWNHLSADTLTIPPHAVATFDAPAP